MTTRNATQVPARVLLNCGPAVLCLLPVLSCAASITTGIDEQAELPYWELRDEGISLRLVQRLPDQTRGFFLARGFAKEDVELIAQGCVFQTVFKNVSHQSEPSPVSYNQRDWVATHDTRESGIKTREDWEIIWTQREAPQAARTAFKWGLFPTQQTYQPGDYNWGMSMFDIKPGTRFDLKVVWQQYGETRSASIENMQCAADVERGPENE
jgi:hypothetical protein